MKYPTLPEDTFRAASSLYGKGNNYLRLGDNLDVLLDGLIPLEMKHYSIWNRAPETTTQFAILTILQFMEELPNRKMVEAICNRVDLKYALHLPMNSPVLKPNDLCEFRRQLFSDPASQEIFQNLLDRFYEFGLNKPTKVQQPDGFQLLISICTISRFDEVVEAMYRALESLAINDPAWLRLVTKPYWYGRYKLKRQLPLLPFTDQKWNARAHQIGSDIQYLLAEIDKSGNPSLASLQEIKEIRLIWEEEFGLFSDEKSHNQEFRWEFSRCALCMMHTDVKEV